MINLLSCDRDKSTYLETKLWVLASESDMSCRFGALCTGFHHLKLQVSKIRRFSHGKRSTKEEGITGNLSYLV